MTILYREVLISAGQMSTVVLLARCKDSGVGNIGLTMPADGFCAPGVLERGRGGEDWAQVMSEC